MVRTCVAAPPMAALREPGHSSRRCDMSMYEKARIVIQVSRFKKGDQVYAVALMNPNRLRGVFEPRGMGVRHSSFHKMPLPLCKRA